MNQGYSRLISKSKQGKPDFYWDSNLDRVQRKRNNQMRDAINKAARFIINQCLLESLALLAGGDVKAISQFQQIGPARDEGEDVR